MPTHMMSFPLTVRHLVDRAATIYPKSEIVSKLPDGTIHRYSFGEFTDRARQLASGLVRAGLKKGDRVATLMWNHYTHLEAYFGIPLAGGVLHTLNLRLAPDDLAYIINHAGDRFLLVDDVLLPLFLAVRDKVKLERVFVFSQDPSGGGEFGSLQELYSSEDVTAGIEVAESDPLGLCYTSGTTGNPKGVVFTHRSTILHSFALCMPDTLNLSVNDRILPVVPMFHVNAWGLPFAATLTGSSLIMPGPHLDAGSLLQLMKSEKVSFAAGVPTIWFGILKELEANPDRWESLRGIRMVVGGSAVPAQMLRAFDRFGMTVLHAWGMTETSPLGTVSLPRYGLAAAEYDDLIEDRARQGFPVPLVEICGRNEGGNIPWDGKAMGELLVRGPWVAGSYFGDSESSDKWTDDGWFRTGDVVTIAPLGSIKIMDRTKDLIKSGGEWISSVDLENALMGHPDVAEAAVIAIPDKKWQERPLAVLVAAPGRSPDFNELRRALETQFPKWWLPDRFELVDQIPRTSTGKFLKKALRATYQRREDEE